MAGILRNTSNPSNQVEEEKEAGLQQLPANRGAFSYFKIDSVPRCGDDYDAHHIQHLLLRRQHLTDELLRSPYDFVLYLVRASIYAELGYPDLAVGDSYRALLLCDECADEGFEYHEAASAALYTRCTQDQPTDFADRLAPACLVGHDPGTLRQVARMAALRCYRNLAIGLRLCGCLRSALDFCSRGLALVPGDSELLLAQRDLVPPAGAVDLGERRQPLPDDGLVRREVYPWNDYEPDRFAQTNLDFLNAQLAAVAPRCEVRVTELPCLADSIDGTDHDDKVSPIRQLGLFATAGIYPGETLLTERSLLAVNNRLKESLCDACSAQLPPLGPACPVVSCPECDDISFCDATCLLRAQTEYHPAVCGKDVETIAKDPTPAEKPFGLYYLLLARCLAMATTQDSHPLQLNAVKYISGDFRPAPVTGPAPPPALPFSFKYHVTEPLHLLEKMDLDIFAHLPHCDLWVLNTLYAKFRGTASARVDLSNGHPILAAVHPLWCLANHDCDPNVRWEWDGKMQLICREKRITGEAQIIKAGQEILSHYCDIDLKVHERREWARGSLGGWCQCRRCCKEAAEEQPSS